MLIDIKKNLKIKNLLVLKKALKKLLLGTKNFLKINKLFFIIVKEFI